MGRRPSHFALLGLVSLATASVVPPAVQEILRPANVAPEHAQITPAPASANWKPTKTLKRRGLVDDVKSGVGNVLSDLGSDIPSFVASGIPNFFQDFPTGDKVQSSLGIDDDQVKALPTQVLNIP